MQAAIKEVEKERKIKIKESLEKGRQEGKAEGMQQEKLKIAKQLLSKGLEMQLICEMTGLNREKLEQL